MIINPWRNGSVLAALKPLLLFSLVLIAVLSVSRLLLVVWQWDRVTDVGMLGAVFLQGLRFDLVLLGLVLVVPIVLFPVLAPMRWTLPLWQFVLRAYLPTIILLVVFMELSTPSFINQFDSRPNFLFFEYLNHPKEVGATLWAAYRYPLLFAVIFIAAFGYVITKWFRRLASGMATPRAVAVLAVTPLLLVLCLALIRSTLDHRPVNPSTVALSRDPLVNELALSSAYTALYAIYETRHESQGGFRYADMDDATAIFEVRANMDECESGFPSELLPTLHSQSPSVVAAKPKNLVIIIEESLGAEFVGSLGGLNLTPNLDQLADEGLWFENLYATGTRSVRGLEAIVSGFTPTPARSVVKLPKSQRNFFTLAGLLRKAGYSTSFIYGGEAQFDNMRRFFMNNGFDRVIDEKNYQDPVFTGSWGVSDEDLFDRAHSEFSAAGEQPFFALVFSSSNHSPFQFPGGRIDLFDKQKNTVNNAVKYADYALGRFVQQARQSSYWNDTVFLIVSDHNSRVYGSELVPIERFHIPGVIVGGSITPGHFTPVASQIDMPPTLLSLIGIESSHPMIGHDLTRPSADSETGRAIMQFNATQAYMEGEHVVVLQKEIPPAQFLYQNGHLIEDPELDSSLVHKAIAHSVWSAIAYDRSMYRDH